MPRGERRDGYTVDEAAELLQFHPDAVRYWLRVGELAGTPTEAWQEWLIWPEDLVMFLKRNGETLPSSLPATG